MNLTRIQLENFRNYAQLDMELAPITALIGDNAQGKTNVLEALAFCAWGKSFRGSRTREVLYWEADYGRIRVQGENEGKKQQLEVQFQRNPELKRFKIEDNVCAPKDWIGQVRAVLFTPDHLDLVTGSPAGRRQFLDRLLLQIKPSYLEALQRLHKILEERNALLKRFHLSRGSEAQLDIWDKALEETAQVIWDQRRAFLKNLQQNMAEDYRVLSKRAEDDLKISIQTQEEEFSGRLAASREHDVLTGSTSVGPQRDDFTLRLGGRVLAEVGSRGECRSAVLALKMGELRYLTEKTGQKPLLLLDDVFSELDAERQAHLSELVRTHPTVLTTTAQEHIKAWPEALSYLVKEGAIE